MVVDSSHGRAEDLVFRRAVPFFVFEVPLLSQEGLTCRLLPGAAAPWSPALDPVSKFPAVARFVSKFLATTRVFVLKMLVLAVGR